jgi:hypothetical protein
VKLGEECPCLELMRKGCCQGVECPERRPQVKPPGLVLVLQNLGLPQQPVRLELQAKLVQLMRLQVLGLQFLLLQWQALRQV